MCCGICEKLKDGVPILLSTFLVLLGSPPAEGVRDALKFALFPGIPCSLGFSFPPSWFMVELIALCYVIVTIRKLVSTS